MSGEPPPTRREVAVAGHRGDIRTAQAGLSSTDPGARATALAALERMGILSGADLVTATGDPSPVVRRRAAQLAARHHEIDLLPLLHDDEAMVVETAAWAAGEHESAGGEVVERLTDLARRHDEALVRESAVAALGAIGAEEGRAAILAALDDKPPIRRRAVLALASFTGPDIDAALGAALDDRDWQVRQAAEDLRRAIR